MTIPDPGFVPLEVLGELVATLALVVGLMVSIQVALNVFGALARHAARAVGGG